MMKFQFYLSLVWIDREYLTPWCKSEPSSNELWPWSYISGENNNLACSCLYGTVDLSFVIKQSLAVLLLMMFASWWIWILVIGNNLMLFLRLLTALTLSVDLQLLNEAVFYQFLTIVLSCNKCCLQILYLCCWSRYGYWVVRGYLGNC